MVTIQQLRNFPFFNQFSESQLKEMLPIAEVEKVKSGAIIFEEGMPAETLYFLLEGCVDLYYTIIPAYRREDSMGSRVCTINPGESFGISALIKPQILTSTARAFLSSRILKFPGDKLQALFDQDQQLAYIWIQQLAKEAVQRLHATRLQLASAIELASISEVAK